MKTLLYSLALLVTLQISAQDPIMQKNNETLETIATNITKTYDDKLGLDGKQFIAFQKVVEEYLIREENIHNKFNGKEKLDMLYNLRKAESMEMRNVLTQPQFSLYKTIKPQIQPLAIANVYDEMDEEGNK